MEKVIEFPRGYSETAALSSAALSAMMMVEEAERTSGGRYGKPRGGIGTKAKQIRRQVKTRKRQSR